LLARKESVDIILRKVLLSGDSFWLSKIGPTLFFLEIDLNLPGAGEGFAGTLVLATAEERP
jgi:hypothetical protein